jgi:F-type H+-transporting ATPase subunit beta
VVAVRGTVVDVDFEGEAPALSSALRCALDTDKVVIAIVHAHVGGARVRAIALDSTRGLRSRAMASRSPFRLDGSSSAGSSMCTAEL